MVKVWNKISNPKKRGLCALAFTHLCINVPSYLLTDEMAKSGLLMSAFIIGLSADYIL